MTRADLQTRFILGTVQFGMDYGINNLSGRPSRESVFEILRYAYENGITELDTANAYGDSQVLLGEFMSSTGMRFDINSKFHANAGQSIREQLARTLEELNVPNLNTYFFHRFDDVFDYPDSFTELELLKKEGLINHTGVSLYTNEQLNASIHMAGVDVIQLPFNLFDNYSKRGALLQKATENQKTLQARSVFLQGLFFKETGSWPDVLKPLQKYMQSLKEISRKYEVDMYEMALAYPLSKKEISSIVIGVDSKEQLERNIASQQKSIARDAFREIDAIDVKEEYLLYPYNWK